MNMKRRLKLAFRRATPCVIDSASVRSGNQRIHLSAHIQERIAVLASIVLTIAALGFGAAYFSGLYGNATPADPSSAIAQTEVNQQTILINEAISYIAPNARPDAFSASTEQIDQFNHRVYVQYQDFTYSLRLFVSSEKITLEELSVTQIGDSYITASAAMSIAQLFRYSPSEVVSCDIYNGADGYVYYRVFLYYTKADTYTAVFLDAQTGENCNDLLLESYALPNTELRDLALEVLGAEILDCRYLSLTNIGYEMLIHVELIVADVNHFITIDRVSGQLLEHTQRNVTPLDVPQDAITPREALIIALERRQIDPADLLSLKLTAFYGEYDINANGCIIEVQFKRAA